MSNASLQIKASSITKTIKDPAASSMTKAIKDQGQFYDPRPSKIKASSMTKAIKNQC